MIGQELEVIYGLEPISPSDAWEVIYRYLLELGFATSTIAKLYNKKIRLDQVNNDILEFSRDHFLVELPEVAVRYGPVTAWNHLLISIESRSEHKEFGWELLVEAFFRKATFIQAWVTDIEYNFWQNAHDPLQYKSHGKSYEDLPMKSNGLPPPLEQINIDTSDNPGRRVIKQGYVEAIGSCIWLGDEFWLRTGIEKKVVALEFPNESEQLNENVLLLRFADQPFTDATDVEIQNKIRNVLYS